MNDALKLAKLQAKSDERQKLFDFLTNKYLMMIVGVLAVQYIKTKNYTTIKRAEDHKEWDILNLRYRTIFTEQRITEPYLPEITADALQAGIIMAGVGTDTLEKIGTGIATVGKGLIGLGIAGKV